MALVLTGATVLDGRSAHPLEGARIEIAGGEFGQVAAAAGDAWAQEVDLSGHYIVPGLFNLHDHLHRRALRDGSMPSRHHSQLLESAPDSYLVLTAYRHAVDQMNTGVTTIREVGCRSHLSIHLRRAVQNGVLSGPRLLIAGQAICCTGGHVHSWSREADGPDEVRRAVREQVRAGADLIKLMASGGIAALPLEVPEGPQFTPDELRAAVEETHQWGRKVTAHAYPAVAIQRAIAAGVDGIEHGVFMDEACIELMLAHGVYLVPTMSTYPGAIANQRRHGSPRLAQMMEEQMVKRQREWVPRAWRAGVHIACGTDSQGEVHEELEAMNAAGIPAMDCIQIGTRRSAEAVGLGDRLGTIEPGKLADLVILEADPLADIRNLRRVLAVLVEGRVVYQRRPVFPQAEHTA